MMGNTSLPPGFFQAGLRAPHMPPGLARKAENLGIADLLPQDARTLREARNLREARSFSSQLIVEQFSLSITMRTQTTAPAPEIDQVSPTDFSAEATAERVFSFSISLFGVYQAQNPDESLESAFAGFEQVVRDAIEEGFGEARNILEELGRLDEQTTEFLDDTRSILQTLLEQFFAQVPDAAEPGNPQPGGASLDSSLQTLELEYRYLSYESLTTSQSTDAGLFSAEYTRLQYESLSFSASFGEPLADPTLQYLA
jgi:hypothetical protein